MIRALLLVIKVGLLIGAIVWLADMATIGRVEVTWRQYLIETTPGVLAAGILAVTAFLLLLAGVWRLLFNLPSRWRTYRGQVTRDDGYRALTQGLVAVAAGDVKRAGKMMTRAQNALPDQPLTRLLTAQTALLQGNDAAARRAFADLLDDPEGAFFGVRGLLNDSLQNRDYVAAREYLRKADQMQPKRPWIMRGLFDLEAKTRQWLAAERTLRRMQRAKALDEASIRQARQVVWLAEARDIAANDTLPLATRRDEALRFAQAAYRLNVDFIPAALVLADMNIAAGKFNAARKLIRRSWEREPHPQFLSRWQQVMPASREKNIFGVKKEIPTREQAWLDWVTDLTASRPDHIESQHALGHAALQAGRWRQARPLLEAAADYQALAQLEQRESGDEAAARQWLEKASVALPAHAWVCEACAHSDAIWLPLCPQCDTFNSLHWRRPDMQQGHVVALRQRMQGQTFAAGGIAVLNPPL